MGTISHFRPISSSTITILVIALSSLAMMIFFERAQAAFGKKKETPIDHDAKWNALKLKWHAGATLLGGGTFINLGFKDVPRTQNELHSKSNKNWKLVAENAAKRCEERTFPGVRYAKSNDPSAVLIFDKEDGYIVGIQSWIPKNSNVQPQRSSFLNKKKAPFEPKDRSKDWLVEDGDRWTKTVYFVDPRHICTNPRTETDFIRDGTGSNGLWIRMDKPNQDPQQYVYVPMDEAALNDGPEPWTEGKCFDTMGQHYWYDVTEGMNCDDIVPFCLLYNEGQLTGMCFINPAIVKGAYYDFPSPTKNVIGKFIDPLPTCFKTHPAYGKLTTVHVFFKQDAVKNAKCPKQEPVAASQARTTDKHHP